MRDGALWRLMSAAFGVAAVAVGTVSLFQAWAVPGTDNDSFGFGLRRFAVGGIIAGKYTDSGFDGGPGFALIQAAWPLLLVGVCLGLAAVAATVAASFLPHKLLAWCGLAGLVLSAVAWVSGTVLASLGIPAYVRNVFHGEAHLAVGAVLGMIAATLFGVAAVIEVVTWWVRRPDTARRSQGALEFD